MNADDTFSKLIPILATIAPHVTPADIRKETKLIETLRVDSLKVAELSLLLEDGFGQSFFLPDLLLGVRDPHDLTVQSLIDFIATAPPAAG